MTPISVKLGMLKLTTSILEEIIKGQKFDLGLIDWLMLINRGKDVNFKIVENVVMKFRDRICVRYVRV